MVKSERNLTKGYHYYEIIAVNNFSSGHYAVNVELP